MRFSRCQASLESSADEAAFCAREDEPELVGRTASCANYEGKYS